MNDPFTENDPQPGGNAASEAAVSTGNEADDTAEDAIPGEVDASEESRPKRPKPLFIALGVVGGLLLLGIMGWLYSPWLNDLVSVIRTFTPTPLPPTFTPQPTRTPTLTATVTITPTITPTPLPASAFAADPAGIDPPIPGVAWPVYILDESHAVTPDPPFDSPVWSSSAQIAADLMTEISEGYYVTYGEGSATWMLDIQPPPGLYEILVMDTYNGSAGPLQFEVNLDGQPQTPLNGSTSITMRSPRLSTPPQVSDQWRSLGYFDLDHAGSLSVHTAWEARDEWSPVAIDRVAVVPLPESARSMLAALPDDRLYYLVDDAAASVTGLDSTLQVNDRLAWFDRFLLVTNPTSEVQVTWALPETVPQGTWEVVVWIPENLGNAPLSYMFLVNGEALGRGADDQLELLVPDGQGNRPGGQWLSLGAWEIPLTYAPTVRLGLKMRLPAEAVGEAAADAVAFLLVPGTGFSGITPEP